MLTRQRLVEVARRAGLAAASPARVIVFGSYARAEADDESDLDLLVVEKEVPDRAAEYLRLREAIGRVGVGVDLLLLAQSEFDRRSQVPGTVPYWARTEGAVLYDAAA